VSIRRFPFFLLLPAIFLLGCATPPLLIDPPNNPASTSAPEGPSVKSQVDLEVPGTSGNTASHTTSISGKIIYTCLMHPEIEQDHPGQCPKCGMTLIPKKNEDHP
jgi:hypothetical protein